jgi:hypothetical protein
MLGLSAYVSQSVEPIIIVPEDVWEERWLSPFTKRKILVAKKNTGIPLSKAILLGIMPKNSDNDSH